MNITLAIKSMLVTAGIDTNKIKRNDVPDQPSDIVVITDTGGVTPDANDTSISQKQHKTFQVYVRGTDHDTVLETCESVRSALVGNINVEVDSLRLLNILMQSEFQSIGKDSTGRWEYTANFSTLVIEAA